MALLRSNSSTVSVAKNGIVYADGVKVGRYIPDKGVIQFVDRDKRRCLEKGRDVVEVKLSDLVNLPQQK
jgi:hypothetical protein